MFMNNIQAFKLIISMEIKLMQAVHLTVITFDDIYNPQYSCKSVYHLNILTINHLKMTTNKQNIYVDYMLILDLPEIEEQQTL